LEARLPGVAPDAAPASVAILGAGIAGASLARAFADLGLRSTVIEADRPGAGASGFAAALVTPRLDAGDRSIAALYASALERAATLYAAAPDAVLSKGVLQLEQAPRDAGRHAKVAAQDVWPEGAMTVLDADACTARLAEPVETGGLLMRDAMAVRPAAVLKAWLAEADRIQATVVRLERGDGRWRLFDAAGVLVMEAEGVVLAAGWGAAALMGEPVLSPVAGQADVVEGVEGGPVAWGGYAVPTGQGLLYGATHDRGVTDPVSSEAASARNLATVAPRLPELATRIAAAGGPTVSRTAVRATTPDRLPLAGALGDGLYVLGGMGSRGFCASPLLAEHVAAMVMGTPSPLGRDLAARVSPARFTA
ncbi:MAG: FAD-dependent oxidoreductase, partial [Variovorax sp.]